MKKQKRKIKTEEFGQVFEKYADAQIAKDRFNDPKSRVISGTELRKQLGFSRKENWRSIQETLYLLSISGMRESIRKGLKTPVRKCTKKLKF
jgi:PHD/YefM family antitoxin component YafN of YafNO toxin-antitoxin module